MSAGRPEGNDVAVSNRIAPATQLDVAKRAGVSRRTVSNVVNGYPYVSAEMKARVQAVVDELGYAPNLSARNLRHSRSGMIALVLPFGVPYFAELAEFLVDEARARSYLVVIDKTDGDSEREREVVMATERAAAFDGVIFSPVGLHELELSQRPNSCPIVLLGQEIRGDAFDRVMIDNIAAAAAATEHLIGLGRRRIAFIAPRRGHRGDTASDRAAGYRKALRGAGLTANRSLMVTAAGFRRQAGADAMTRLLSVDDPPDAVFCYNDPLALGAMRAVLQRGLRVPEDVAIVGFDDSEDGRFSTPTLTTIAQDKHQIARCAVELLVSRLEGNTGPGVIRRADWQLITRESTLGRGSPLVSEKERRSPNVARASRAAATR